MAVIKKNILRRLHTTIDDLFTSLKDRQWGLVRRGDAEQRKGTALMQDSGEIVAKDDQGNIHVFLEEKTINNTFVKGAGNISGGDAGKLIVADNSNATVKAVDHVSVSSLSHVSKSWINSGSQEEIILGSSTQDFASVDAKVINLGDDRTGSPSLILDKNNSTIVAPKLDSGAISVGGDQSLVTKKYSDDSDKFSYHEVNPVSGSIVIDYNNGDMQELYLTGITDITSFKNIPVGEAMVLVVRNFYYPDSYLLTYLGANKILTEGGYFSFTVANTGKHFIITKPCELLEIVAEG